MSDTNTPGVLAAQDGYPLAPDPPPDWAMGALAAQQTYRPLGNDPWTNTMSARDAAQQAPPAPPEPSPVLYPTASPRVNITQADIDRGMDLGMGFSGGGLTTKGIKAYHSSPHDFDKFDLSKIGSGEGAQVYGHGLYFSENPAVSGQGGQYWNQFLKRFSPQELGAATALKRSGFDREAAIADSQWELQKTKDYLAQGNFPETAKYGTTRAHYEDLLRNQQAQHNLLTGGKPVGPRTYEVNINADPAQMLDWDKPLAQQHPQVTEAIRSAYKKAGVDVGDEFLRATDLAGHDAYGSIGRSISPGSGYKVSSPITSQYLNEAGIPGIRYLDQGSRLNVDTATRLISDVQRRMAYAEQIGASDAAKQKLAAELAGYQKQISSASSNYVMFDPNLIDILRKYVIAGAAPAGLGALAAQDQYQE